MTIQLVPTANVDPVWPMVSALVVKCLEKAPSYLSAGDLWQMCRSGQAFLFVIHDGEKAGGVAIWQFAPAFGQHAFVCLALAGEGLEAWIVEMVEIAGKIAADGGAEILSATGRVGLLDPLRKKIPGVEVARQTYIVRLPNAPR